MEMLSKKWVLVLINAIIVLVFASLLILFPIEFLKNFVFVIGTLIAFVGLILIFGAFNYAKESSNMVFWLFQGLFNLVVGAIVMFFPEASSKFLLILAGLWAIVLGVYQFSIGLMSKTEIKHHNLHKINGLLFVIIGLLLIFAPEIFVGTLIVIFGIVLMILSLGLLYFAIMLKKLGAKAEEIYTETEKKSDSKTDTSQATSEKL
ncbi:MAG: DUF308 domain-containing protein [Bacteroidota bacterium]